MMNCPGSKESPTQRMVCHLSGWLPVNIAGTGVLLTMQKCFLLEHVNRSFWFIKLALHIFNIAGRKQKAKNMNSLPWMLYLCKECCRLSCSWFYMYNLQSLLVRIILFTSVLFCLLISIDILIKN